MATVKSMLSDFAELSADDRVAFLQKAIAMVAGGKAKSVKGAKSVSSDEEKPKTAWQEHCAHVRDIRASLLEEHAEMDIDAKVVMTVASATYDKATKTASADDEEITEKLLEASTERPADAKPRKAKAAAGAGSVSSKGSTSAWQEHCAHVRGIQKELKEENPERVYSPKDVMRVASETYDKATKTANADDDKIRAKLEEAGEEKEVEEAEEKPKKGKGSRGPMSPEALAKRRAKAAAKRAAEEAEEDE